MKRPLEENLTVKMVAEEDEKMKKIKTEEDEEEEGGFVNLDENLLFEILKRLDGKTLAFAACVSKQWSKTAQDERLWEMICTRHWTAKTGNSIQQLRSVVLALGGFRRLHSLCLWPLLKPASSGSGSSGSGSGSGLSSSLPVARPSPMPQRIHWGKDEMNLSLSLMSIRFYKNLKPMPTKPN